MKKSLTNILNSISTRIVLIFIVLILPLNILVIGYMNQAKNTIIGQAEFNSQKIADYYMQALNGKMQNAQSLLSYFMTKDEDCIRIRIRDVNDYVYEESKMKFYYKLRNMAEMTDGADGYFFYYKDKKDSIVYGNADGKKEMVNQIFQLIQEESGTTTQKGWHIYEWNNKKYLVFLISDPQLFYGCVLRLDEFIKSVQESIDYPNAKIDMGEQRWEINEKQSLYNFTKVKNIYLNIQIRKDEILRKVSFTQKLMQMLAFLYLVLIPVLYLLFRKILICPLKRVNDAHRQVEGGNGQYHIEEHSSVTEYKELYCSFNKMVDHLNQLKIESYEKEISRQKMELRNLQLQIRPHFLLNTFNLIFTLSQRKENTMIQETVIYLSDYFRYIFRNEKELEIFSKELKMIKGYVKMASIRYFGRIEVEYDLDPEIDFIRMPPLLIHNFVENAVKYGVRQKEVLHIQIIGKYEDRKVIFEIRDDGNGMAEEMLQRNQKMFRGEYKPQNQSEHLGLYNSLKRLKYFYGETAGIEVESERGKGTVFRIYFPYDVEEEE